MMETTTRCKECKRYFDDADGELHPTEDGIACPYCGALNLFTASTPPSWEELQEQIGDEMWEKG